MKERAPIVKQKIKAKKPRRTDCGSHRSSGENERRAQADDLGRGDGFKVPAVELYPIRSTDRRSTRRSPGRSPSTSELRTAAPRT